MSFALGPLLFLTPLALLALLGLPLLWFVLRATPPQPKDQTLPSFALFEDMEPVEETPDKTPWWIITLRMLVITLAIIGLSTPVWSPRQNAEDAVFDRDVLVIVDDGWTAAPNWSAIQNAALGTLGSIDRDLGVYVISSTQTDLTDALADRLSPQNARGVVQAMRPNGWRPDYDTLAENLSDLETNSFDIVWVSDNQLSEGFAALSSQLTRIGNVDAIPVTGNDLVGITGVATSANGPILSLARSQDDTPLQLSITAYDDTGASLATARGSFEAGTSTTELRFDVPESIQTGMSWFRLNGQNSAGAVWQWDGAGRMRRVGLVGEGQTLQPLLSDAYYVRNALSPFATIVEGTLDELMNEELNVLILTDVGELSDTAEERLSAWVEDGGVLIRFAGPRMAAQSDDLLPVRLRRASRALDSALSWDTPQELTSFSETGPFARLSTTRDQVMIRRQVLAQPDPQLASRTWARLADGTPLVTSETLGRGRVTLFHVTAGPEWSDLPLAGVFVEMMRYATLPARELAAAGATTETSLAPRRWLSGFGDFVTPAANARPLQIEPGVIPRADAAHPAGLYQGGTLTLTLNAGAGWIPEAVTDWPNGVTVRSTGELSTTRLGGFFLTLALLLLLIDLIVSLLIAGRLRFGREAGVAIMLLCAGTVLPDHADAQNRTAHEQSEPRDEVMQAALTLRFAYVITDDATANTKADAGLRGLSMMLYRRTTVEPDEPIGLNLAEDPLNLFPFIMLVMPESGMALTEEESTALGQYLRNGGALLIDTTSGSGIGTQTDERLTNLLNGLDVPPLMQASEDHVLSRAFYLLDGFYGRYPGRPLWIESGAGTQRDERRGDGVSTLFITDADMASAWAVDEVGRPLYSVDGGNRNRELAFRTGINIVMYILTGNYKEDQVHLPALLERLGESDDDLPGRGRDQNRNPRDLTPGGDR